MNHANLGRGIMPSFSEISQNQEIELLNIVLDKSKIERVTLFHSLR